MFVVKRSPENPLLTPVHTHPWESAATFNWCPTKYKDKTVVLYRALSEPEILSEHHLRLSTIGYAESKDGTHFSQRKLFLSPQEDWEKYGCEDPRVTKLGNKYYIFYTALSGYPFNADNIKVAVATTKDFKKVDERHLVTPFNAKAMVLFPEKINGKLAAFLTVNTDRPPSRIAYVEFKKEEDLWNQKIWDKWYQKLDKDSVELRRNDDDHLEIGAPPIKTKLGWLLIYSHIQHYYDPGRRTFGIEAALLDLKNPKNVIAKTKGPFIVPEEHYEIVGSVPNITFPSGGMIRGKNLEVYYGATDTYSCKATINLDNFLNSLVGEKKFFERSKQNPILKPRPEKDFETNGVFNPGAIEVDGNIHILYRAFSNKNSSTLGYARTKNGEKIIERSDNPIYTPQASFEGKGLEHGGGVEDPRLTIFGDTLYVLYTAFDGNIPQPAITSIKVRDFLAKKWAWKEPKLLTPQVVNKDTCLLPKKVGGKYMIFHRLEGTICADFSSSLDFDKDSYLNKCIEVLHPRPGTWDSSKVGIASPPIETKEGWLMFYHGVSKNSHYRIGAVLLDLKDPTVVLARTSQPVFQPTAEYERSGVVDNVVFPCGLINRGGTLYLYYGAADYVVGVAKAKLSDVLKMLKS